MDAAFLSQMLFLGIVPTSGHHSNALFLDILIILKKTFESFADREILKRREIQWFLLRTDPTESPLEVATDQAILSVHYCR